LGFTACSKKMEDTSSTVVTPPVVNGDSTIAPDNFTFATSKEVSVNIRLLTNDDKPIPGVMVNLYNANPAEAGISLFNAFSDANGYVKGTINIPAYMDTLLVDPAYVGLISNAKTYISGNQLTATLGGSNGFGGNIVQTAQKTSENGYHNKNTFYPAFTGANFIQGQGGVNYNYLGGYDGNGRPTNLVSPGDVVSAELLSFINASLPETKPVPTFHPDYLTQTAETNLNITALSDVFVTFVHEGAGYLNSLGFYTYPTNNPPKSINDIKDINITFPNASLPGSGGALKSGDKVKLGRFEAGTSIGFVLFQNAWNSKSVNTSANKYFADDNLNNEKDGYKRHTVLLYDDKNKLFLVGFEDQQRDNNGSDNDFNDLMFYATSNPVEAISHEDVNPIDKPVDADKDGVNDTYDKFPTDPTRAYINYYPAEDKWGTLNFEDLWPSEGDYDVNDLVLGYRYTYIKNAQNKTVEMYGDYAVRAVGATFLNGFGVQFPFSNSQVAKVSGQKLVGGYIKTNGNGTEAGQSNAVIIPFDNTKAIFPDGGMINTFAGASKKTGDTAHIYIAFNSALSSDELGVAPYNPFLISKQVRGNEVHLPGTQPTDLANTKLFGTAEDKTNPAKNTYYLSNKNWPYAMNYAETFDYPIEKISIAKAYTKFLEVCITQIGIKTLAVTEYQHIYTSRVVSFGS
ncbi:MAG: LruC domain-containing protein, partial [Sphingobacteriales bacterium]